MPEISPQELVLKLRRVRLPNATEQATQDACEEWLKKEGIPYEREVVIGEGERVDFLIAGEIGLEIKVKYPKRQIYRQLERYSLTGRVTSLVLLTGTYLGLPAELNGVPVYMVSMGRAAL